MAWMTLVALDWKGGRFEHPFDIVDVPHKAGVFKLHARGEDGSWEVFYAGQASNLYFTLLAYMGTIAEGNAEAAGISKAAKERITQGEIAYSYAVVTDAKERSGCVRSLIEYFGPAANDLANLPDVADIGCNPF